MCETFLRYIHNRWAVLGVSRLTNLEHLDLEGTQVSDVSAQRAFAERCDGDRHHFRFIVSPDDAEQLSDLKAFTRDLAVKAQRASGRSRPSIRNDAARHSAHCSEMLSPTIPDDLAPGSRCLSWRTQVRSFGCPKGGTDASREDDHASRARISSVEVCWLRTDPRDRPSDRNVRSADAAS